MARGNNEANNPNRKVDRWSTPAMKAQLAYEAKRDTYFGAPVADIAESVSEQTEPKRKVDRYAYMDKSDATLSKHMQGDSSDYENHLKSEGFLTPSGKTTGAGRLNPLARTDKNWDK
jgi:hypothetical protein